MTFDQLWAIAQIFLIIIILVASLLFVKGYVEKTLLDKSYLVRDFSLLLTVSMGAPGNLFFNYPNDFSDKNFYFDIGNGNVRVRDEEGTNWVSYHYGMDTLIDFTGFEEDRLGLLFLNKKGNELIVDSKLEPNMKTLECPEIETTNLNWESEGVYISLSDDIKDRIFPDLRARSRGFSNNYDPDIQKYVFGLHTYESSDMENNGVKAYVNIRSQNYLKSRKLACILVNKLSEEFSASHANIVVIDPDQLDPKYIDVQPFLSDKISVFISFGNKNIDNNPLLNDPGKISGIIQEGFNEFFEDKTED
ncbi:MAG: hypothetical protein ABII01_06455 [Candidatus Woesearchaeota archaeon]